jgi:hypothetical protein
MEVRQSAARALGGTHRGQPSIDAALLAVATDRGDDVLLRISCMVTGVSRGPQAGMSGALRRSQWVDLLRAVADDATDEHLMRTGAAWLLTALGERGAVSRLAAWAEDATLPDQARRTAVWMLAQADPAAGLRRLLDVVVDGCWSETARAGAILWAALHGPASPEVRQALLTLARREDTPAIREAAATSLCRSGWDDPEVLEVVSGALADPALRSAALAGLLDRLGRGVRIDAD